MELNGGICPHISCLPSDFQKRPFGHNKIIDEFADLPVDASAKFYLRKTRGREHGTKKTVFGGQHIPSITKLAHNVGVSAAYLAKGFQGKTLPSRRVQLLVASALNISPDLVQDHFNQRRNAYVGSIQHGGRTSTTT